MFNVYNTRIQNAVNRTLTEKQEHFYVTFFFLLDLGVWLFLLPSLMIKLLGRTGVQKRLRADAKISFTAFFVSVVFALFFSFYRYFSPWDLLKISLDSRNINILRAWLFHAYVDADGLINQCKNVFKIN